MRQEIRIDEYAVWRNKRSVILKEQGRGYLRHFADDLCGFVFLFRLDFAFEGVLLELCVVLPDYSFDLVGLAEGEVAENR